MGLHITAGLVARLQPLLVHLGRQLYCDRMAARCRLESRNSLTRILKEGDLDLSLANVFHRIGLPVK